MTEFYQDLECSLNVGISVLRGVDNLVFVIVVLFDVIILVLSP